MKYAIPEISWHNRDPVLSLDFQPKVSENDPLRLATGGTDSHVLIWYISTTDSGAVNLEVAADLTRHQKAVNVVRWSPSGQYLASGDDEAIIFIWRQNLEKEPISNTDQIDEPNKESWVIHKTLRGHMEDVLDVSWSPDSLRLASGSVDNRLVLWDAARARPAADLADHRGFVQGVAWDPRGQYIATACSDRQVRVFDAASRRVVSRSHKAVLPLPPTHALHGAALRLYHDDTLQTYYRRLAWSPGGALLAAPAGRLGDADGKAQNVVYIYTRYSLKVPACVVPCDAPALAVRWSPRVYRARPAGPAPAVPLPRMLLAVATRRSVLLYDTQQLQPVAYVSNIHYTRLTDLSWSPDGRLLAASSTDGFCSVMSFAEDELGETLPPEESMEVEAEKPQEAKPDEHKQTQPEEPKSKKQLEGFMKFKAPEKSEKSPTKRRLEKKDKKTPVKPDFLEEMAMPSWSDNSNNDIIKPKESAALDASIVIEDSEDIKLVYEESVQNKSVDSEQSPDAEPKQKSEFMKQAKVTDVAEAVPAAVAPSPKAPRRVSFVTLSSPKNTKKKS